jgi:hypothetical protein
VFVFGRNVLAVRALRGRVVPLRPQRRQRAADPGRRGSGACRRRSGTTRRRTRVRPAAQVRGKAARRAARNARSPTCTCRGGRRSTNFPVDSRTDLRRLDSPRTSSRTTAGSTLWRATRRLTSGRGPIQPPRNHQAGRNRSCPGTPEPGHDGQPSYNSRVPMCPIGISPPLVIDVGLVAKRDGRNDGNVALLTETQRRSGCGMVWVLIGSASCG